MHLQAQDIVSTGGGVQCSSRRYGPHAEFANLVEAAASDINVVISRTANLAEVDYRIAADSIVDADVNASAGIATN